MRSTRTISRSRVGKKSRDGAHEEGNADTQSHAASRPGGFYASGPVLGLGIGAAVPLSPAAPAVQRFTDEPSASMPETVSTEPALSTQAAASADPSAAAPAAAQDLLVEDTVAAVGPGQMRRSDFLAQLRAALEAAVSDSSAIDSWFTLYGGRSGRELEGVLHSNVPATAGARTAQEYIPLVVARARQAESEDASDGVASRIGGAVADAAAEADSLFFKESDGGARAPASAAGVQSQLGSGHALDPGLGSTIGSAFGEDFSGVRIHTDERAARLSRDMNARAFTVGGDVAFGPGEYRPGTPIGDALIAHELAHVAQQKAGARAGLGSRADGPQRAELESESDRSAAGAMLAIWGDEAAPPTLTSRLRSGLALQRCSRSRPPEAVLLDELSAINDEESLEGRLHELNPAQLQQIQGVAPSGSRLAVGIQWELAVRNRRWSDLITLHRANRFSFQAAYGRRVVAEIMAGRTNISVAGADRDFNQWVDTRFGELAEGRAGFLLILQLLAAGQPIAIGSTTGENATAQASGGLDRFVSANDDNIALPVAQQYPGARSGSNISYNPSAMQNSVTLGGTPGHPELIQTDETVTFGHELIHALHNARGENIAPTLGQSKLHDLFGNAAGYVNDPMTGHPTSPEELRTITGQRDFAAPTEGVRGPVNWPLHFNLGAGNEDVTENMLRAEHNLPARSSHEGATRGTRVHVRQGETLEQMLARYSMPSGAIPAAIAQALRAMLIEMNPFLGNLAPAGMPVELDIIFPNPAAVGMYVSYIAGNPGLREAAQSLRLRQ